MKPNGQDQRARHEILGVIEAYVGRAPLDWMLGQPSAEPSGLYFSFILTNLLLRDTKNLGASQRAL